MDAGGRARKAPDGSDVTPAAHHAGPPAMTPAAGEAGVRLVDLVRQLAEARGVDPLDAGLDVARAIEAHATEPTVEEAWVATALGVPRRRKLADTIVNPKTGKVDQREIEWRVRRVDLAEAARAVDRPDAWLVLAVPDGINYLEGSCRVRSFHVAPAWIVRVLEAHGIPVPEARRAAAIDPGAASPAARPAPWPGWPNGPESRDVWAEPLTALAEALWRDHGRWMPAATAWRRLYDAPPPGFGIVRAPHVDDVQESVEMGDGPGKVFLSRRAFAERWRRWTRPR